MSHAVISEIEKTFFLFYPINVSLFEIFKIIDRLKFLIIFIKTLKLFFYIWSIYWQGRKKAQTSTSTKSYDLSWLSRYTTHHPNTLHVGLSGSWAASATQNQHFDIHWRKWPLFPQSKSCNSSNVFSKILGILFRPWMFIYSLFK